MWVKETLTTKIYRRTRIHTKPNNLEYYLEKLGISYNVETLQKSVLWNVFLGTVSILRKALSIKE